MKLLYAAILISIISFSTEAQKTDDILATATGLTFRLRDLSVQTQKDAAGLPIEIPRARIALLDQLVSRRVFDAEAKARGITVGKLLAAEKAKVKNPTDAEVKAVMEANQDRLGSLTSEQAVKQVVAFLRNAPEQKALGDLFTQLKSKFKVTAGMDVNAAKLVATDVVATVNGEPVTAKEFEEFVRIPLYEARADLADVILDELDDQIYQTLVTAEARELGVNSSEVIAREITNKMKDFSDVERFTLEDGFRTRLYSKYQVKILYIEPEPPVQNISIDDDPATGPPTAQVTVVMFSDFQCSACAATHPILKKVIAEYSGKIRFVVRDFPLESIHENAFRAALAAGAAAAQDKFVEYTEILYGRQNSLDDISLVKYAAELGLNVKQFELDFNSKKIAAEVRKDMTDGESYGIGSTPTIYVNGVRVRNLSPAGFRAAIGRALGK